jgi:hypothetical protein
MSAGRYVVEHAFLEFRDQCNFDGAVRHIGHVLDADGS